MQAGRLTAATAVSLMLLLLAAEAWEVGVNLSLLLLVLGAIVSLFVATAFIFTGQNLGQIPRAVGWREQLTRTRIVIFGTVLLGMIVLWLLLFAASFFIGWLGLLNCSDTRGNVCEFNNFT